jgi:hypothetical protein
MSTELAITIINVLISTSFFIGVYKNKIDTTARLNDQFRELETRIVRLEEKINFLIEKK